MSHIARLWGWEGFTGKTHPHIFTSPTKQSKKWLHLDVLKADGVALMHCCSAYIVTLSKEYAWSRTDKL